MNNNPLDFSGKVALVTGAASGMGLATAQTFAEAGAAVVLTDFREDVVKAEAQKLMAAGHKAIAFRCDVSDDGQVAAMVDRTVTEFGRIDAAFNNAGVMARIAPKREAIKGFVVSWNFPGCHATKSIESAARECAFGIAEIKAK